MASNSQLRTGIYQAAESLGDFQAVGGNVSRARSALYGAARGLGDVQAVQQNRVADRMISRLKGKALSSLMSGIGGGVVGRLARRTTGRLAGGFVGGRRQRTGLVRNDLRKVARKMNPQYVYRNLVKPAAKFWLNKITAPRPDGGVPVDTGRLRNSWINYGVQRKGPTTAEMHSDVEYAAVVEFGRSDMPSYPAQPYVFPHRPDVIDFMERLFQQMLNRMVRESA